MAGAEGGERGTRPERRNDTARTKGITDKQLRVLCYALPWKISITLRIIRYTGLRISDVLSLRKSDIAAKMDVRERKTGKTRQVHLPAALVWECRLYGSLHRGAELIKCDRSTIYRAVHNQALRLGWDNISAHSVRKLYARAYARKYGIEATQRELGHDNLATTMLYLHDD